MYNTSEREVIITHTHQGLRLSSEHTNKANFQRGMGEIQTRKAKRENRVRESFRQGGLVADSFLGVVVVMSCGFIVIEDWMRKKESNHAKTW